MCAAGGMQLVFDVHHPFTITQNSRIRPLERPRSIAYDSDILRIVFLLEEHFLSFGSRISVANPPDRTVTSLKLHPQL